MDREEYFELVKINTGIEITSVESSNIESIGYNVKKHHLWVSFKNNKIYINWNTFNENYSKLIKNIESENYERIYDLIRTCTKNIEVM